MRHNTTQTSAIAYRLDPQVRQMLGRLPEEVTTKLSEQELVALYQALTNSRHRSVGLRLSLPLVPKRLYCFTSVGLERRDALAKRTMQKPASQKPSSMASLCLAMSMSLFAGLVLGGGGYHILSAGGRWVSAQETTVYPTALPWIEEEAGCDGKSRQWKDGFCYEQAHNPDF